MKVYLNQITGIDDAITSMFMSKRTWTRELEENIRMTVDMVNDRNGKFRPYSRHNQIPDGFYDQYNDWMDKLTKWTKIHITLGRFIDFSITVEGLHRAGQDDWDSHAKRFDNRIIRTSTRLSEFGEGEKSYFYKGKILTTDEVLNKLGIQSPTSVIIDGSTYVKTVNGYVKEEYKDNQDVKRGLYMLSIPSDFIFKVNLTEWAHVYKQRCNEGGANPEVKECCEMICDELKKFQPWLTRKLFSEIQN